MTESTTPGAPSPVTVIGLGAMGKALAEAFVNAGHPTTVWNRTPGKADDLVARGAALAPSITEAVTASPLVVVCVVDEFASRRLLEPLGDTLAGRTLVNLSSDTPERARDAAAWAASRSISYLDGAILVPTPLIGTPDAVILVSGPQDVFETHRATLQTLAGKLHYFGSDTAAAAIYDVALLDIFHTTMASMVHALALARANGVAPTAFASFAGDMIVGIVPPILLSMANAVEAGEHPGHFDKVRMEATGVAHIIEASRARGLDVGVLVAVKGLLDRAIAAGHGDDSFSSVIDVLKSGPSTA